MSDTRSWADLARTGAETLAALALRGQLPPSRLWTAMRGARRFVVALAAGDVAPPAQADERATCCVACASATTHPTALADTAKVFCGSPFIEARAQRTCGCLVALTVRNGTTPMAAGKTLVASEHCPQGKW